MGDEQKTEGVIEQRGACMGVKKGQRTRASGGLCQTCFGENESTVTTRSNFAAKTAAAKL